MNALTPRHCARFMVAACALGMMASPAFGQGVTTSSINGLVTSDEGVPLAGATVTATHDPSATQYRATVRPGGVYNIPNMRVGGPYRVTVTMIGFQPQTQQDVFLTLAQNSRLDFRMRPQAVTLRGVEVTAEQDPRAQRRPHRRGDGHRSGARSRCCRPIKRSTRDLTRLDPRSDGNMAFGGRNWLYNNISLDGSYFNNPFGLDDPAPGGQTNAEPVPFDAVEQVQVSLAPFDVREGGFTGANINTVTKSGTNEFRGSAYTFLRNDAFQGNNVSGSKGRREPRFELPPVGRRLQRARSSGTSFSSSSTASSSGRMIPARTSWRAAGRRGLDSPALKRASWMRFGSG